MPKNPVDAEALVAAWQTNNRTTTYLVENLPADLWAERIPSSRRTVRHLVAHVHNSRCSWIKMIGERHGVKLPVKVDAGTVKPSELLRALGRSSRGMIELIRLAAARGGSIPAASWQNFPTDLAHFLSYFVAHEAHHRGQLVLLAKLLGYPLSKDAIAGLWQWKARSRE